MKKKRINNDLNIRWELYDKNGNNLDLSNIAIDFKIIHATTRRAFIPIFSTENNIIISQFPAINQLKLGKYYLYCCLRNTDITVEGGIATYTFDSNDVFELVEKTALEDEFDEIAIYSNIEVTAGGNIGGGSLTEPQKQWIGEGKTLINGATSLPEGINMNTEELTKKAPINHNHDYAPSDHNHNELYAPCEHTHTDLLKKPDTDGTAGQVLTITEAGLQWKTPSSTGGGESIPGSGLTEEQKAFLGASGDLQTEAKDSLPKAINEVSNKVESLGQEIDKLTGEEGIINMPAKIYCFCSPTRLKRVPLVLDRSEVKEYKAIMYDEETGMCEYLPNTFDMIPAGSMQDYTNYIDEDDKYIYGYQYYIYRYDKLTKEVIHTKEISGHYKSLIVLNNGNILVYDSSKYWIIDSNLSIIKDDGVKIDTVARFNDKVVVKRGNLWIDISNGQETIMYDFSVEALSLCEIKRHDMIVRTIGNNTVKLAIVDKEDQNKQLATTSNIEGLYGGFRFANEYFFVRHKNGAKMIIRYDFGMGYYHSGFHTIIKKIIPAKDCICVGAGTKLALWTDNKGLLHYLKPY